MKIFFLPVLSESRPNTGTKMKRLTPSEPEITANQKALAPISSENMGSSGDMKAMPSISANTTMKIAVSTLLFKQTSL
jgi:hypothetical protein